MHTRFASAKQVTKVQVASKRFVQRVAMKRPSKVSAPLQECANAAPSSMVTCARSPLVLGTALVAVLALVASVVVLISGEDSIAQLHWDAPLPVRNTVFAKVVPALVTPGTLVLTVKRFGARTSAALTENVRQAFACAILASRAIVAMF